MPLQILIFDDLWYVQRIWFYLSANPWKLDSFENRLLSILKWAMRDGRKTLTHASIIPNISWCEIKSSTILMIVKACCISLKNGPKNWHLRQRHWICSNGPLILTVPLWQVWAVDGTGCGTDSSPGDSDPPYRCSGTTWPRHPGDRTLRSRVYRPGPGWGPDSHMYTGWGDSSQGGSSQCTSRPCFF